MEAVKATLRDSTTVSLKAHHSGREKGDSKGEALEIPKEHLMVTHSENQKVQLTVSKLVLQKDFLKEMKMVRQ